MNMMHKRESGENPERCRHCVRELLQSPLGNREGEAVLNEVRELPWRGIVGLRYTEPYSHSNMLGMIPVSKKIF